jgi:hypothetical protein
LKTVDPSLVEEFQSMIQSGRRGVCGRLALIPNQSLSVNGCLVDLDKNEAVIVVKPGTTRGSCHPEGETSEVDVDIFA